MISDIIQKFSAGYVNSRQGIYQYDETTNLLTSELPKELYSVLNLNPKEYLIKASVGTGNWSDIPWFAIMHRGVTTSTQNGYYVTGLISRDLSTLYLTIGLGWTQFADKYGNKNGRTVVSEYALRMAALLPKNDAYIQGHIDMGATSATAKGYEVSNAVSLPINIHTMNDELLIPSIQTFLNNYKLLRDKYGSDILFTERLIEDTEGVASDLKKLIIVESTSLDKSKALLNLVSLADTLPAPKRKRFVSEIVRNAAFANHVKFRSGYVCEICGKLPFIKRSGKPYAEADHIDPLYRQGKDHPDNMRCLCAQCHRVLTYGSDSEIQKLFVHAFLE